MCLGVPGKVLTIRDDAGLLTGRVDFGGAVRDVCLSYVPEVEVGNYVIVHVGFAISLLDEEEAQRTLEILASDGRPGGAGAGIGLKYLASTAIQRWPPASSPASVRR